MQARAAAIFAGLTFRLILIGIILAMFVNTYASITIPIPLLPDIKWEGWAPKAKRLQATIDQFDEAQKQARAMAEAQLKAKEAEYRDKARKADDDYEAAKVRVGDATDRFIAANRVREGNSCPTGSAVAAAPDNGPSVPEGVPADPFVAVRASELHTVSDLYAYALSCRAWGLSLGHGE